MLKDRTPAVKPYSPVKAVITLLSRFLTVAVKDDTATCIVESRSTDDFLGNDVEDFNLVLIDKDNMRYRGEQQGLVGDRDIFTRDAA